MLRALPRLARAPTSGLVGALHSRASSGGATGRPLVARGASSQSVAAAPAATAHEWSVRTLMDARVHMGHRAALWNPRMAPYILGERNGMHVIDLDKTVPLLRRALVATTQMAAAGSSFLWLGPRDVQKARIVRRQATRAGVHVIEGTRWIGGSLTNPVQSGQAAKFGYRLPDCVFVIDVVRHRPALREAKLRGIPVVAVVDTDCDPSLVTYPIPGNDDGAHAVYLYCQLMRRAIMVGRNKRLSSTAHAQQ